jgi:hypothetical protein
MKNHKQKSCIPHPPNMEQKKCAKLLGDFVYKGSRGDAFIQALCPGKELCLGSLKAIGMICQNVTGIKFDRDYQRQKALMYLWFTNHYDSISFLTQVLTIDTEDLVE